MNHAVLFERIASNAARVTLTALVAGLALTGCGGGGGGGNGICAECDEDLNIPSSARVIIPDGANMPGQINYPTDQDWFRFRGIEGVFYTLQIEGFPPDPDVSLSLDLTGDGIDLLQAEIRVFDAVTQLQNSTGSQGGSAYDINAAGIDSGTLLTLGDSRIVWACPLTNDYYIRIRHRREFTGIGAYEVHLGSSQLMTIFSSEPRLQTGARYVDLFDDDGVNLWDNWVSGFIKANHFEFIESLGAVVIADFEVGTSATVVLPGNADPESLAMHMHVGYPNVFAPEASFNLTDLGDPAGHAFILDIPLIELRDAGTPESSSNPAMTSAVFNVDGEDVRVPVLVETTGSATSELGEAHRFRMTIALGDAIAADGSRGIDPGVFDETILRTFFGFPWYFDLHVQPDLDLDPFPVTVSLPQADLYQFFETDLVASDNNVILPDGSRLIDSESRGVGSVSFSIFYDTALKTFQVAEQQYFIQAETPAPPGCGCEDARGTDVGSNDVPPPTPFVIDPDYADFVGDRVRVHRGGPGETGPTIIDLGTLPPLTLKDVDDLIDDGPGFRVPIRQLTDPEVDRLREAFYGDGFYVQVTDRFTGAPLVRAEGLLEISTFPFLEPCSFPPCNPPDHSRDIQQYRKGKVNFARTTNASENITVILNGERIGVLDEAVSRDNLPACGLTGDGRTLAAELWPETYFWRAFAEDGTSWEGYVTITPDSCETVLLE